MKANRPPNRRRADLAACGAACVLLALVEKGVAREEAYSTVHDRSMESWANETDFRDLVRADIKITSKLTSEELDRIFDYSYFVRHVDEIFERVGIK